MCEEIETIVKLNSNLKDKNKDREH